MDPLIVPPFFSFSFSIGTVGSAPMAARVFEALSFDPYRLRSGASLTSPLDLHECPNSPRHRPWLQTENSPLVTSARACPSLDQKTPLGLLLSPFLSRSISVTGTHELTVPCSLFPLLLCGVLGHPPNDPCPNRFPPPPIASNPGLLFTSTACRITCFFVAFPGRS